MHMLPLQQPCCKQTCRVFVLTSSVLVTLCAVFSIAAHVEWRARREFLHEQGRSGPLCKPRVLVCLQHCWWLVLCTWAVGLVSL